MGSSVSSSEPAIGDVLYLHDKMTRLSRKDVKRWCVVAGKVGQHVRVVGRSASRQTGVFTPAGTLPEFDRDGYFWPASARVSIADARRARNIGTLPEPYLSEVLAQYRRRRKKI